MTRALSDVERDGWLRLKLTPGVGDASARKLLAAFGLPPALFAQPQAALAAVVGPALAERLLYPLWDARLRIGHGVRTPQECEALAAERRPFGRCAGTTAAPRAEPGQGRAPAGGAEQHEFLALVGPQRLVVG